MTSGQNSLLFSAILVVALAAPLRPATAQDSTTRLPTVIINAIPDPPGPGRISGIVADTGGRRLAGVEISIPDLRRRVFSDAAGRFFLGDIPRGRYDVRAKRIGYAPQVRPIVVDSAGGVGAFALLPFPYVLNPVITSATGGGLAGMVFDASSNPVPDAEVHAMGRGETARTDSTGWFFLPIRSGTYSIGVTRDGFRTRLVSVVIPADSGRWVDVYLRPRIGEVPVRQAWNVEDLSYRLAFRKRSTSMVFTRADMLERNMQWAYDAVSLGAGMLGARSVDRDCMAVMDGGPGIVDIGTLTVDDVELVEVYVGGTLPGAPRPKNMPKFNPVMVPATISNAKAATMANLTRHCPLIYVWLR